MKKRDQKNLAFLMAQTPESLLEWYQQADGSDIEYAAELLRMAQTQQQQQQMPTYIHQAHRTVQ